jgi:hypothetical protein
MLSLLILGRRKKRRKKKREVDRGFFPTAGGCTHLDGCAGWDFHSF